jgi:CubicO group peptidase (beta-lactamase class C family)
MAMLLYERGQLELEAPVVGVVPEFMADSCGEPDPRRRDVTFRMLLTHSSGLPAYEKLFLQAHTREDLLRAAFTTSLSTDPGTHAEYSDIGFIVLGAALERIAGESLDLFCQREIFGPLGMSHTAFNPPRESRDKIPPTADERDTQECGADTPVREMPQKQPITVDISPQAINNKQLSNQLPIPPAFWDNRQDSRPPRSGFCPSSHPQFAPRPLLDQEG